MLAPIPFFANSKHHLEMHFPAPFSCQLSSPLGTILVATDGTSITSLTFTDMDAELSAPTEPLLAECASQLEAYFSKRLTVFDLPIAPLGTDFQQRVWAALTKVAHGHTATYGDLAHGLGDANLTRAVGAANGSNPIAIIIPCHRIIGANGSLTGYSGGLWRKQWLLAHESAQQQLF